ncbi:MAG: LytTR family DNA-binding domain-containing protein [Defluviitaleaceae bacterium]|nr:LytTR family DNA-binding domain-containing protein [Defluviitaleaceae bacterium]
MLKIFICEDDESQLEAITKVIKNVIMIEEYNMEIVLSTVNPYDVLEYLEQGNNTAGAYFLDVDLNKDINGIELAEKIRDYDPRGFIVIITALKDSVPLVFVHKIEPLDFIHKSDFFNIRSKLEDSIKKINDRYIKNSALNFKALPIKTGGLTILVEFEKIISVETVKGYVEHTLALQAINERITFSGSLTEIQEKLDKRFVRPSQSYILNAQYIESFASETKEIIMKNGCRFSVPVRKVAETRKLLSNFL